MICYYSVPFVAGSITAPVGRAGDDSCGDINLIYGFDVSEVTSNTLVGTVVLYYLCSLFCTVGISII